MPKKPKRSTGQHWKTFLKNHSAEIVSMDFLVVPTITFRLLYVLVFLSHDRRKIIHVNESVSALGIRPILTTYWSPWQNGYVERLIGSIRRECLDHLIIMNEGHLRKVLNLYIHYYSNQRTHLGLNKDSAEPRTVQADGKIDSVVVANGLHHFYFRKAA